MIAKHVLVIVMSEGFTLDEYNERMERYRKQHERTKHLAGVLCPKCKEKDKDVEMHIENPGWVNTSNPPTQCVFCPECGHRGLKQR